MINPVAAVTSSQVPCNQGSASQKEAEIRAKFPHLNSLVLTGEEKEEWTIKPLTAENKKLITARFLAAKAQKVFQTTTN